VPPAPDGVADASPFGDYTYPTEVPRTSLLPGGAYGDSRVGHPDCSFYVPLSPSAARVLDTQPEPVGTPDQFARFVVFVGIAVFHYSGSGAPSET